jgi:Cu/Zn superoxide dismutase
LKLDVLLVTCVLAAACGGGRSVPVEEPEVEPAEDEEPEERWDPPPPPQEWSARAELVPAKGAKMKPGVVRFTQVEGEEVRVMTEADLVGLKAGTYHLVIHEGAQCGKNGTKAGKVWPEAAAAPLDFAVTKATAGAIDVGVSLMLDGESSIVGRTLVLHDDKKGKPGKVVACGPIQAEEAEEPEDDDEAAEED